MVRIHASDECEWTNELVQISKSILPQLLNITRVDLCDMDACTAVSQETRQESNADPPIRANSHSIL